MAEILPFRALRYNPEIIPEADQVVTQPYDKITPEMQARYYDLSPHNLVRIIRGRHFPEDTPENNVYSRAAGCFQDWIQNRILIAESEPALYLYTQEYCLPGRPEERRQRHGFIGLGRLEDYSAGIVHRHEETLSGPKADRLELLKRTRAHFGQIFMLYSDLEGVIDAALAARAQGRPWQSVTDEYGSRHSVWRVADPATIQQVVAAMRSKKLIIADGHHRYETALAYRDYRRAQVGGDERAEYAMMTFIRMEGGLTILPTHRIVRGLTSFDWREFTARARRIFDWEDVPGEGVLEGWRDNFLQSLALYGRERPALGAYAGRGKLALLRLRQDIDLRGLLPSLPESLRRLDVVILHRLVLEGLLGIDPRAVREEENLRYVREPDLAIQEVNTEKAQVCFLLNPTPIQAVCDNAFAGQVLPQKSTDFYPKLLSGLAIYWLDNPLGM